MLTDRIRVELEKQILEPEDFLAESLGIFPDETRILHGCTGSKVIYNSRRFGDIQLSVADVSAEKGRVLFADCLWNSSLLLAELVSDRGEEAWNSVGEIILELGGGLGLAGVIGLLCGAKEVVISDYPSMAILENIQVNVERNVPKPLQSVVSVKGHIWGHLDDEFSKTHKGWFTRIFAADCFWIPGEHENILDSMSHFLSDSSLSRIFAVAGFHTGRAKLSHFFDIAGNKSLEVVQIYEIDVEGQTRQWQRERDGMKEDITERERW